jgi:hypothetical protein
MSDKKDVIPTGGPMGRKSPSEEQPSTLELIRKQRLMKLKHQNSKLKIEVRRLKGEVAPVEQIKGQVIQANLVVKTQLLALPVRLADQMAHTTEPSACAKILQEAIIEALNNLAYERTGRGEP